MAKIKVAHPIVGAGRRRDGADHVELYENELI
jgi:hypothetical protein